MPYRIVYEYQEPGVHQIILDPEQFFGYLITFMQRTGLRVSTAGGAGPDRRLVRVAG